MEWTGVRKLSEPLDRRLVARDLGDWLRAVPRAVLEDRRWFATKGRGAGGLALRDFVFVTEAAPMALVTLAEVDAGDGIADVYHLLWIVARERSGPENLLRVRIEAVNGEFWLQEAWPGDGCFEALLRAFAAGRDLVGRRGRVRFTQAPDWADLAPPALRPGAAPSPQRLRVRVLDEDQSNAAAVCEERLFFKGYRKVEAGRHPEVELLRCLGGGAGAGFVPRLAGDYEYAADDGSALALGLVDEFVPGARATFAFLAGELRGLADGARADAAERLPLELGDATAELHAALALTGGELGSEPCGRVDVRALKDGALALLADVVSRREVAALADAAGLERAARRVIEGLDDGAPAGLKMRIHGDYHLGQTLYVPAAAAGGRARVLVTDFEGEPARPLAERRRKYPALKDVAGMLRSFSYARSMSLERAEAEGRCSTAREAERSRRLVEWEERARRAFVATYTARMDASSAAVLPPSPAREAFAGFFELEKALYEVRYELASRAESVWIPIHGLRRMLGVGGAADAGASGVLGQAIR